MTVTTLADIYASPTRATAIRIEFIDTAADTLDRLKDRQKTLNWLSVMASAARLAAALLSDTEGGPVGEPQSGYLAVIEKLAQGSANAYATLAKLTTYQPDKAIYMELGSAHRSIYQHIHNSRGQAFYISENQSQPIIEWFLTDASPIQASSSALNQADYLSGDWQSLTESGVNGMEQALLIMASGVTVHG